ncbi:hypothetical protein HPB51_007196 [Rhipicephalus microplus]|uniref:Uncharacterized protein n=1 Tax=Rhipicephalus microplus TaxID=6941 RepID=A0A9J6E027_RHIMP|nr:hypothetical protein HPB51_007196 [Rhipicephalus microplus]
MFLLGDDALIPICKIHEPVWPQHGLLREVSAVTASFEHSTYLLVLAHKDTASRDYTKKRNMPLIKRYPVNETLLRHFYHQRETSKNSEKRKEKSRDAARCRRSKESEIFTELSQQLPLPESVACQLDKASVMRLAISYLRLREILEPIAEVAKSAACSIYDSSVLEALDAVLLVLSAEGEIVFLSDNVGRHLGLNQVDLMGQSVYEYCHPCDHDELKAALLPKPEDLHDPSPQPCHFLMRLRCTLGSKGRGVSVKSASSYKVR